MQYREAKKLAPNDRVRRISDQLVLIVSDIEVYGKFKFVRINCRTSNGKLISVYHNQIENIKEI